MNPLHLKRLAAALLLVWQAGAVAAQTPAPQPAADASAQSYVVFFRARPIGREEVAVIRQASGWVVRGNNSLGPPLEAVARLVEIHYDAEWRPSRLLIEGTSRGQEIVIKTTFAEGRAKSTIDVAGAVTPKDDAVSADTIVLPNAFLGSYAALTRRLQGAKPGATLRGYIAPQGEVAIRVDGVFPERIDTPQRAIEATRYAVIISNPEPAGDVPVNVWADAGGALLRFSVPSQGVELAREDIASAASRTAAFSLPGDEAVRIPASGFNLAATVTRPAGGAARLPAIILVGGSGPIDRDGFVAGIPVIGQMAQHFVEAGFLVVRYDKRGVGQSGGRTEASTLSDYAEDVRAITSWLEKRKDVDKKRIAVVGHSEGAWVAMTAAARDKRLAAIVLIAGAATTGAELVLEQQRQVLVRAKTPEAEREAKIALQKQIQSAVLTGKGWEAVAPELRKAADTPWFQSLLAYDPARTMRDVRQPLLVVQGELDAQVPPQHADKLIELARARKRKVASDVVKVAGVNHLLVEAKTGEVSEYASLAGRSLAREPLSAISAWLTRTLTAIGG